ncbi:hypothetical protein AMJ44_12450 [candidate division WOR-1 bacterium DG_54_3]|uniref:Uncharacterized protein n=1 Tax=candidate division WOR-1 bacterium DG_54_3 TaxID=1703775 RepID=A0A0S7XQ55_UNCSA|nr:MAG: hypothetical protein AMJ44_12450 [candidate division WOR-1 bacterium DG_54_3]
MSDIAVQRKPLSGPKIEYVSRNKELKEFVDLATKLINDYIPLDVRDENPDAKGKYNELTNAIKTIYAKLHQPNALVPEFKVKSSNTESLKDSEKSVRNAFESLKNYFLKDKKMGKSDVGSREAELIESSTAILLEKINYFNDHINYTYPSLPTDPAQAGGKRPERPEPPPIPKKKLAPLELY